MLEKGSIILCDFNICHIIKCRSHAAPNIHQNDERKGEYLLGVEDSRKGGKGRGAHRVVAYWVKAKRDNSLMIDASYRLLRCHYSLICLHVDLIVENFLHVDLRGCKFGRKEGGQLFFLLFTPLLFHYGGQIFSFRRVAKSKTTKRYNRACSPSTTMVDIDPHSGRRRSHQRPSPHISTLYNPLKIPPRRKTGQIAPSAT